MTKQAGLETPVFASTRRQLILGGVAAIGGVTIRPQAGSADSDNGISRSEESIHQEPSFAANRKRVYDALTTSQQFDQVTQLSGVMQTAPMAKMKKPTDISGHAGGEFVLFGGLIVGRHIELVPNELIVQAWRVGGWGRGVYSMVKFDLTEQGSGTKILFDHTGFPKGAAEHLAAGWQAHYWSPLEKFLA